MLPPTRFRNAHLLLPFFVSLPVQKSHGHTTQSICLDESILCISSFSKMTDKIKGTVKWFSNRKGFGFITPTSDNSPTTEDIFVHQSNIVTEADTYRSLVSERSKLLTRTVSYRLEKKHWLSLESRERCSLSSWSNETPSDPSSTCWSQGIGESAGS